ncbi:hypothetical protein BaRGS_00025129 [Batillaria attramentaria]|uniref:Uncharacterized protein n=1 Tax=Batillaria attramentaria TaxID=370345 RepID=A0ABD0K9H5_9CAEN
MAPVHSQLARLIKEERLVLLILLLAKKRKSKSKRRHRFWIHPILRQRRSYGAFFHLVRELQMDGEKFRQYFRLSREQFGQVQKSQHSAGSNKTFWCEKKCHAPLFCRTSAMRHAEKSLQCPIFNLPQWYRRLAGSVPLPQRTNGFMSRDLRWSDFSRTTTAPQPDIWIFSFRVLFPSLADCFQL